VPKRTVPEYPRLWRKPRRAQPFGHFLRNGRRMREKPLQPWAKIFLIGDIPQLAE
jgi:hypothetical protein